MPQTFRGTALRMPGKDHEGGREGGREGKRKGREEGGREGRLMEGESQE